MISYYQLFLLRISGDTVRYGRNTVLSQYFHGIPGIVNTPQFLQSLTKVDVSGQKNGVQNGV